MGGFASENSLHRPLRTMGFLLGKLGAFYKGIPPVDGMKGVVVDNGSVRVCLSNVEFSVGQNRVQ